MPQRQVRYSSVVHAQRNVFFPTFLWHLLNCSLFKDNGLLIEIVPMDLGKGGSVSAGREMKASMAKGSGGSLEGDCLGISLCWVYYFSHVGRAKWTSA